MTVRLAVHLAAHQLPEFQRAARSLLRSPLVTNQDPAAFALVRRWEPVLRQEFSQKFGYRLDVSRNSARLLRRPSSLTPHRPARLRTGRTLDRWGYVYFCLALAALEAPGQQVLASELLTSMQKLAQGDQRISIDQTKHTQRRAFSDALVFLVSIGVLRERDGVLDNVLKDEPVLFDVDRDAAALCLVASPSVLREVNEVGDFLHEPPPSSSEGRSRAARQRLNRRIIDQPVVLLEDLTEDERELAWRNRRREADNLTRLTGCEIELRSEGLALIDVAAAPIGPRSFPGRGSVAQASLLWLDQLVIVAMSEQAKPDSVPETLAGDPLVGGIAPATADSDGNGSGKRQLSPRWTVPAEVADTLWATMIESYGPRFNADARAKPAAFREQVIDELVSFGLLAIGVGLDGRTNYSVSPAAARYRADAAFVDADGNRTKVSRKSPTRSQRQGQESTLW